MIITHYPKVKGFTVQTASGKALTPANPKFGYALGHKPPHYPVPATMDNGNTAMFMRYYMADLWWNDPRNQ